MLSALLLSPSANIRRRLWGSNGPADCRCMKLPRFTIRDLLLSTALIAAGIACLSRPSRLQPRSPEPVLIMSLAMLPLGPPLTGAGLTLPFGVIARGALWGALLDIAVIAIVLLLPASFFQ